MFDPRVGMKIYDNVWYLRHRLEPEEAADILAGQHRVEGSAPLLDHPGQRGTVDELTDQPAEGLVQAEVEDLAAVPGISRELALRVKDSLEVMGG